MKLIIAGGREFNDISYLSETVNANYDVEDLEIVCGMARGADHLGLCFANSNQLPIHKFPAEWDKYGKSAGYRRNAEMATFSDSLLAFWDGKSKGTKHMIDLAEKNGLAVQIVRY